MKAKNTVTAGAVFIFLLAAVVFAADSIRYDFDSVDVEYAAEFDATPVNVAADNWLVEIAGGTDKPVHVLYGVVRLMKDGKIGVVEEFIKVSGEGPSKRFLMNGGRWEYWAEGEGGQVGMLKSMQTQFWSAKLLVDSSITKDFTPPIKSLVLYREYPPTGTGRINPQNFLVTAADSSSKEDAVQYWVSWAVPKDNYYKADMSTARQAGEGDASAVDDTGCTKEARSCPDGSVVGRVPPSCEFAPCPAS